MSITEIKRQFTECFILEGNEVILPDFESEDRAVELLVELERYALDAEQEEKEEIMTMVRFFSVYLPVAQTI